MKEEHSVQTQTGTAFRHMTVLQVAYPFAPVSMDSVGGAEQVLYHLHCGLLHAGCRSIVIATEDSQIDGELVGLPAISGTIDEQQRQKQHALCLQAIAHVLNSNSVSIVHLHGIDFAHYLPKTARPVLVTLHLPLSWYPDLGNPSGEGVFYNCVSHSQARSAPPNLKIRSTIMNGIPVDLFAGTLPERADFALCLGRICPEKGFHLALDAADEAGIPLLIGGLVFPYPEHQRYFQSEIQPRLKDRHKFIGPVDLERKRLLLSAAQCLIVPSLVEETGSLVAMEALACGTPVIAFARGALPEIVEHGVTGFLVNDTHEIADAIKKLDQIDRAACTQSAQSRFTVERMNRDYLACYEEILQERRYA